jgi:hypothetical protein
VMVSSMFVMICLSLSSFKIKNPSGGSNGFWNYRGSENAAIRQIPRSKALYGTMQGA